MYKFSQKKGSKNNDTTKQKLLDFIYSSVDLSKYRYEMIETRSDLSKIFNKNFYLTPNFVGNNCLLVFTKLRDKYYSFLIDRKTLSYSKNRVDINKVDFKFVNVDIDSKIFFGTILDGVSVKVNNVEQFIISDCYFFQGNDYSNVSLDIKLYEIQSYLKNNNSDNYTEIHNFNNNVKLHLSLNKLNNLDEIDKFVNKVIPNFKDCKIRGICFYPELSGNKLIYLFSNNNTKNLNNNTTNSSNNINSNINKNINEKDYDINNSKITKYKFVADSNDITAILEMKKTDTVDIYRLFSVEKITQDKKTILRRKKMGIALIPTIKKSHWCKNLFSTSNKDSFLVKCSFDNDKGKWIPIELDTTRKYPTLFSDIDINIMEVSDSDDE